MISQRIKELYEKVCIAIKDAETQQYKSINKPLELTKRRRFKLTNK